MRYVEQTSVYFPLVIALSVLFGGMNSAVAQTSNTPNSTPAATPVSPPATGSPPTPTASSDGDSSSTIKQLIASNSGTPKSICGAIKPILYSDPGSASAVIDTAQSQPNLMEPLCECLSQTQTALKKSDPDGAKLVAKAVSGSSPAFQACYAVALVPPSQSNTPAPQVASDNTGGGNFAPFNALSTPINTSTGGGPVTPSPN